MMRCLNAYFLASGKFLDTVDATDEAAAAAQDPVGASALEALTEIAPVCMTLVSPSRPCFDALRRDGQLLAAADRVRWHDGSTKMVHTLLRTLFDERMTVLCPDEQKGYEVCFSGIPDNMHLHMLLAGRLMHADGLAGTPPTKKQIAVLEGRVAAQQAGSWTGRWNMLNFTCVASDGTITNTPEHFIWGEGVPCDIAKLAGERICVLAPAMMYGARIQRSLGVTRVFGPLQADLRVVREMSAAEVAAKIAALACARQCAYCC